MSRVLGSLIKENKLKMRIFFIYFHFALKLYEIKERSCIYHLQNNSNKLKKKYW